MSTIKTLSGRQWTAMMVLLTALLVTVFAYRPGLSGSLHYDDPHNLNGLAYVSDAPSAISFATSGRAGPLGRPIALGTFAVQAYAWPHSPMVFLHTNIHLHALNGALVVWMLYLLSMLRGAPAGRAAWVASMSGAIWMLLPLLVSSSLLIVQRMTTLAATFVFLGFVAYLYSRRIAAERPRLGIVLMSASVGLATALAALTKENGALLPVLILVAEGTLLKRPARCVWWLWKGWVGTFLMVPSAALAVYLALRFQWSDSILNMRDFTVWDRLLTQAHVLWEYLYRAFLPLTSALGPFHDHHAVYRDWLHPLALAAVLGWAAVVTAAVALRHKYPLLTFSVAWYLVGHVLESTTIPLELYFEHRNYVPLVGPIFGLVAGASTLAPKFRRLANAGLSLYAAVMAAALFSTTSLWGHPHLAAEMWAIYNPSSKRATQYLGQQLQRTGDHQTVRRLLRRYQEEHATSAAMELQLLGIACLVEPRESHAAQIDSVHGHLGKAAFEHGVFESIERLYRMARAGTCDALEPKTIYALAARTAANPNFQKQSVAQHNLHVLMAEEAYEQRDLDLTMHHIESALSTHYAYTTLLFAVHTLTSAGLYSAAEEFVEAAYSHRPKSPLQAVMWNSQVAGLERALRRVTSL